MFSGGTKRGEWHEMGLEDKKAKFVCKIYEVTARRLNNYNTHIAKFLKK